jgi:general secretion pathway protein J
MRARQPRTCSAIAGFTLVEALVATVLMGVVLAALATITAQWLPNWSRGFVRVQRSELVAVALDRIVADLKAAEFMPPNRETKRPLFEGTELSVTFVRPALGPNTRPGLEIVRIAETADRRGPALVRSRALFAPQALPAAPPHFSDPVVLLSVPYRASFSYAGRDGVWRGNWLDAKELPSAVRLIIRDTATGRTLSVSTATVIHAQLPAECVAAKADRECGDASGSGPTAKSDTGTDNDERAVRSR